MNTSPNAPLVELAFAVPADAVAHLLQARQCPDF